MKKLIVFSFLLSTFSVCAFAETQAYKLDDAKIDMMFEQSVDVTTSVLSKAADLSFATFAQPEQKSSATAMVAEKTPVIAFILAFFLGGLGIHRLYMGTKTMTWVGYILTCGGIFGIVPFVDWILLLIGTINDDIDKYVDNPKFFMW